MAQKITVIDDLDGSPDAEEVSFGYMGKAYAIDLAPANRERFNKAMAEFIEHARKGEALVPAAEVKRTTTTRTPAAGKPGQSREQGLAVREWGRVNGFEVSERGRIPRPLQEAYDKAHKDRPARGVPSSTAPKPALPTREQLAEVHAETQPKPEPKPAPPALFSAPEQKPAPEQADDGDSETGGSNDAPEVIEVTSAGLKAWMESKGMPTAGVRHPIRLAAFKQGHPNVTVKYIKDAS